MTQATTTVEFSEAALIRCVARQDMPAYGLTEGQVFYLAKSSSLGENQYHILPWNYEAMRWDCPCKCGQGYNHQVPCCHTKAASKDCKQPHTLQGFKPATRGEKFALLLVKYDIRFQASVIEAEEVAEVAFSKPIGISRKQPVFAQTTLEPETNENLQAYKQRCEASYQSEKRNQAPLNGRQGFQLMR